MIGGSRVSFDMLRMDSARRQVERLGRCVLVDGCRFAWSFALESGRARFGDIMSI